MEEEKQQRPEYKKMRSFIIKTWYSISGDVVQLHQWGNDEGINKWYNPSLSMLCIQWWCGKPTERKKISKRGQKELRVCDKINKSPIKRQPGQYRLKLQQYSGYIHLGPF